MPLAALMEDRERRGESGKEVFAGVRNEVLGSAKSPGTDKV